VRTYNLKRLNHGEKDHVTRVIPEIEVRRLLGQVGQLIAYLLVDLGLVVQMGAQGLAFGQLLCARQRRPDVVFERGGLGRGAGEVEGLLCFDFAGFGLRFAGEEVLPEVCYAEDGVDALVGC
jgi:hypothetical protein